MPQSFVETLIPKPLFELHSYLTKLLLANHILTVDTTSESKRLASVLDSIVAVQKTLANAQNHHRIKTSLEAMSQQITASMDASITQQVQSLVSQFEASSE